MHIHGQRRTLREDGDRPRETEVGQHSRVDAAGEFAELIGGLRERVDCLVEQDGSAIAVVGELCLDHAQRQSQYYEPLLGAVVKIALDLSTGRVFRSDDPRARSLELGDPRLFRLVPAQYLLRVLALGDLEDHTMQRRSSVALDDMLTALEYPRDRVVGSDDPVLERVRSVLRRRSPYLELHLRLVVRVDDAGETPYAVLDEVRRRIPGDALDLVADHRHRPVAVECAAIDRARDVRDERSKLDIAPVHCHARRDAKTADRRLAHETVIDRGACQVKHGRKPSRHKLPIAAALVGLTAPP